MAIESGEEKKGTEIRSVSPDKMWEIMQEQQKQIQELLAKQGQVAASSSLSIDDITKIIKATKDSSDGIDKNWEQGIDESQIPVDDYLEREDWVIFFSPCGGTCIVDDRRKGQRVLLPYGKKVIWFQQTIADHIQKGKDMHLLVLSNYVCKSKKEAEWIRNHSLFGFKFFESIEQTIASDVVKMQRLSRIMSDVQQYSPHNLLQHAKSYNVPVGEDFNAIRYSLAQAMADAEEKREYTTTHQLLLNTEKNRLFEDHATLK